MGSCPYNYLLLYRTFNHYKLLIMSSFSCKHCYNNRNRNFEHNEAMAALAAGGDKQLVSGILQQYYGNGLEILTETLELYVPGVTEQMATDLTEPQQFRDCIMPGVHIPLHHTTGDVLAIPAKNRAGDQTVMLVQLTSDPENRHLAGHYAWSPSGNTTPVHGCMEGLYETSMLRVEGTPEPWPSQRQNFTRPLHTICRTFRLLGYLSRSSDQFDKIVGTKAVATSKHLVVDMAHILSSMDSASSSSASNSSASNSSASNSSASSATATTDTSVDYPCKCDPADSRIIQEMLDEVHAKHKGGELEHIEGCTCPFCKIRLVACYTCGGVCLNEAEEEEECV